MKVSDLTFKETVHGKESTVSQADYLYSVNTDYGWITVLDRVTGWGNGIRDVETGYKDNDGKFWLASGRFDIRDFPDLEVLEAIETIKKNANTCIGV